MKRAGGDMDATNLPDEGVRVITFARHVAFHGWEIRIGDSEKGTILDLRRMQNSVTACSR
eukprot:507407-Rhodomonas_salina.1